jgi:hypothetical protein
MSAELDSETAPEGVVVPFGVHLMVPNSGAPHNALKSASTQLTSSPPECGDD